MDNNTPELKLTLDTGAAAAAAPARGGISILRGPVETSSCPMHLPSEKMYIFCSSLSTSRPYSVRGVSVLSREVFT